MLDSHDEGAAIGRVDHIEGAAELILGEVFGERAHRRVQLHGSLQRCNQQYTTSWTPWGMRQQFAILHGLRKKCAVCMILRTAFAIRAAAKACED